LKKYFYIYRNINMVVLEVIAGLACIGLLCFGVYWVLSGGMLNAMQSVDRQNAEARRRSGYTQYMVSPGLVTHN
jgi:hypothetical protein